MELLVERRWRKDSYTVGLLYVNGELFGNTMEDKDRNLTQDMEDREIRKLKVYGETAIPTGRYKLELTYSSKFCARPWAKLTTGRVPQIMDVPGFSGIRIHPLNCAQDSLGCIGVGKNDRKGWISRSTEYYTRLLEEHLLPAWKKGESVYINVI